MKKGFALPTTLVVSLILLSVLVGVIGVTVAVRSGLQNQRYAQLAEDASKAGVVLAQACLQINEHQVTWSDEKPLRPNTDCNGDIQAGYSQYVEENSEYRTYFVVTAPSVNDNGTPTVNSAEGYVEALRASTGTAWRVFSGGTVSAVSVAADDTPVGTSVEGYWATAPDGYLLEDGSAVSRTVYADLFAVIGTTYGAGDGSTTFNLPDSRGRVLVARNSSDSEFNVIGETGGEKAHTLTDAEVPSTDVLTTNNSETRQFRSTSGEYAVSDGASGQFNLLIANTSSASGGLHVDGGGGSHNNLQPYITVTRAIKY